MRDHFWYSFSEMLYRSYYIANYKKVVARHEMFTKIFLLAVSSTSISAWTFWGKLPVLWAILTAVSQLISIALPMFKQSEQLICIDFFIPELEYLITDMESIWLAIDTLSDSEIRGKIKKIEMSYQSIQTKYLNQLIMFDKKACIKTAEKQRDQYLSKYIHQESEVQV